MGFADFLVRFYFAREETRRKAKRPARSLPDRIAKLPEDDPERLRYQAELEQDVIPWLSPDSELPAYAQEAVVIVRRVLVTVTTLLVVSVGGSYEYSRYMHEVQEVRHDIRYTLADKGYTLEDPFIRQNFANLEEEYRLSRLRGMLWYAHGLRTNLARLPTTRNPAEGSYLAYIQAHELPFQTTQAILWSANEYR